MSHPIDHGHQPAYCSFIRLYMSMESHGGIILTGEPNISVTLTTINPTWSDLSANPALRSERPATNRLSSCMAHCILNTVHAVDYSRERQNTSKTLTALYNRIIFAIFHDPVYSLQCYCLKNKIQNVKEKGYTKQPQFSQQ
jgi:hypothetical protein